MLTTTLKTLKTTTRTTLRRRNHRGRFFPVRIKWVADPVLDETVTREKNLIPSLTLKNILLSYPPSRHPSLSAVSVHKHTLKLFQTTPFTTFLRNHPSLFHPPCNVSPRFNALHNIEKEFHDSHRLEAAKRLCKLLMITRAAFIPLFIIDGFKFDLGLPWDYVRDVVTWFPDWFRVCEVRYKDELHVGLGLVKWRAHLAKPAIMRAGGRFFTTRMSHLDERIVEWNERFQRLPYVSPYENLFGLSQSVNHAQKWTVSFVHEILSLMVTKKTETENVLRLGEYLGFRRPRLKMAIVNYPGIFYYSNKLTTSTLLLRSAFRMGVLIQNHPLIRFRDQYIELMSESYIGRRFKR